jgi:hypothetical protein
MTGGKVQPGVKVSETLWERFRQDVTKRRGTVHGNLSRELENAIEAYLDGSKGGDMTDELRRLREEVETIRGAVLESGGSGGADSVSKTTENRIDEIMADIRERADQLDSPRVREEDVEAAIERNAGASYKTIQRYKKLLQNQRAIFAHPTIEDVYFVRPAAFIACVEQGGDGDLRASDAQEIRSAYGDEWWVENAPSGMLDEDGRGFQ